jgi:hypothetical protein
MQSIYVKTEKGNEEMANRTFHLPSRVRSLLVMVDGKTSAEQLLENTAVLGDSAAFLKMLIEEGFIKINASTASESTVKVPSQQLIHGVSALVLDILGPGGDQLCVRLEQARSMEEFAKQVDQCRTVIENSFGKNKSDKFWGEVLKRLTA